MTNRIIKAEFKKLLYQKALLTGTVIFVLVFILTIIFSVFAENNFAVSPTKEITINRDLLITEIADIENQLQYQELTDQERSSMKISLSVLNFFLQSNTNSDWYYTDTFDVRDGGALMMKRFSLFGTILTSLFAILAALITFGAEYKGRFRLSLLQGATKKSLFFGKTISGMVIFLAIYVIFAIIGIICTQFSPNTKMLSVDYYNYTVRSTSITIQYIAEYLSMLIASFFMYALSLFLCAAFKKNGIVIGILAAFFALSLIMVYGIKSIGYRQAALFPVLSLIQLSQDGYTIAFILSLVIHSILSAVFITLAYFLFRRQSF